MILAAWARGGAKEDGGSGAEAGAEKRLLPRCSSATPSLPLLRPARRPPSPRAEKGAGGWGYPRQNASRQRLT